MKTYYKCSNCERFLEKKDIERISYSKGDSGHLCVWIKCKVCQKLNVINKLI